MQIRIIEAHRANYHPDPSHVGASGTVIGGPPIASALPAKGTTYIAGMGDFLNIAYTFIGQITIPSFIAEMRKSEDFYKPLLAVSVAEVILFSIVSVVIYAYTRTQCITSPAFGSLGNVLYKKISFSFMIPTIIFVGVLYASVSARFIFFRLFEGSDHKAKHTFLGWLSWILILLGCWIIAFIIAEIIPFFSDLLSIMSALFDSFLKRLVRIYCECRPYPRWAVFAWSRDICESCNSPGMISVGSLADIRSSRYLFKASLTIMPLGDLELRFLVRITGCTV